MLAPIMGPVVGGITIDATSWRFLFFIPFPIAGLSILLGTLFMPEREADTPRLPFDWVGYALVAGAIVCMMTAIANGQRDGWASDKIVLLGSAGVGLASEAAPSSLGVVSVCSSSAIGFPQARVLRGRAFYGGIWARGPLFRQRQKAGAL